MMLRMLVGAVLLAGLLYPAFAQSPKALGGPEDVPSGFDFPAVQSRLEAVRDAQDLGAMRLHAWRVFAGINQPSAGSPFVPVWLTWDYEKRVFDPATVPAAANAPVRTPQTPRLPFELPRQLESPSVLCSGCLPLKDVVPVLSIVYFNRAASEHIREIRPWNGVSEFSMKKKADLNDLVNKLNGNGKPIENWEVPPFPPSSVAVKTVWKLVPKSGPPTVIPVFDPDANPPNQAGNPPSRWARNVKVDASAAELSCSGDSIVHAPPPHRPDKTGDVPITRFFYLPLCNSGDAISAQSVTQEPAAEGDYVVLVAMHYTTREIPNWVWATFWWHDRPDIPLYGADRPSEVREPWSNYVMNVAYDMDTPREPDETPRICFNPWLEGQLPNGLKSNCMTCHRLSIWPPVTSRKVTRGTVLPDHPLMAGHLRLSFLWSIACHAFGVDCP